MPSQLRQDVHMAEDEQPGVACGAVRVSAASGACAGPESRGAGKAVWACCGLLLGHPACSRNGFEAAERCILKVGRAWVDGLPATGRLLPGASGAGPHSRADFLSGRQACVRRPAESLGGRGGDPRCRAGRREVPGIAGGGGSARAFQLRGAWHGLGAKVILSARPAAAGEGQM